MAEEKTIREWLNELPEPYRTEAFEEAKAFYNDNYEIGMDNKVCSMASALSCAFIWDESSRRFAYWRGLFKKYKSA